MAELSDESSENEMLSRSLSMWYGEPLDGLELPLDLHTAASIGQCEVVQQCVRRKDLDLNKENLGGWTPLMYASYIGHDAVVNLLLDAGVDVNKSNPTGQTPLMLASSCGNESVAYFLLQRGAEIEKRDARGWTALFHCTSAGHQRMLRFLLENGANGNLREPVCGFTPLIEAAASGHEIIVQHLLNHGVKVTETDRNGDTARMLAARYGHTRIVSLLDSYRARVFRTHGRGTARHEDVSSSDESSSAPQRHRPQRRAKGPSIHDGPQALAKITGTGPQAEYEEGGAEGLGSCSSDAVASASGETSLESNEDSDPVVEASCRKPAKSFSKGRHRNGDSHHVAGALDSRGSNSLPEPDAPAYSGPKDLAEILDQIGCMKYLSAFQEQDINLRIFLTLTESDLREVGITLFGPKRKMTSAIARWHSSARPPSDALEQAYADRLEAEMQELAIQLHKRCEETELLKAQVAQERELRAVAESCLMEQDTTWRTFQCQLEATCSLANDAQHAVTKLRSCQEELSHRLGKVTTQRTKTTSKAAGVEPNHIVSLKPLSMLELSASLEESTAMMGKSLRAVQENLEKMRAADKGRHKWPDP